MRSLNSCSQSKMALITPSVSAFVLGASAILGGSFASAQTTSLPPVLDKIEAQGIRVLGELKVPGGLRGFAAKAGSQPLTIYLTPDNKHVVVGTLVDGDGTDIAADQVKELSEVPIGPEVWQQLQEGTWIQDGDPKAEKVIYTFTDPNCPYCNQFWTSARPWVEAGKVQLRHLLVGVIRQDSPAKAAAILEADSPEQALTKNELTQGGIEPVTTISQTSAEKLQSNAALMTELGFGGTPAILYKDANGQIKTMSGLPQGTGLEAVLGPK